MLASEPLSSRIHPGGGISVRVNGAIATNEDSKSGIAVEQRSGNPGSKDNRHFVGDSEKLAECRAPGWATITWRAGAQHLSGSPEMLSSNDNKTSVGTPPTVVPSFPPVKTASDASDSPVTQLVHVIRVQSTAPNHRDLTNVAVDSSGDMDRNGSRVTTQSQLAKSVAPARIRITSNNNNTYQVLAESPNNNTIEYCKDKISVVVGPSLNHIMKGEDERSSSGASSAPGSDCERSDSDRENEDGTDSGFSSSRRHCASIIVNAKNSTNVSNNYSSLTSSSSSDYSNGGITKVPVVVNGKGNVKLTIASYADKEADNRDVVYPDGEDPWDMHFHLRELDTTPPDKKSDSDDVQSKITAAHALLSGQGGMFTLKNRVRSSIVSLLVQSASNRNYDQEEVGRIVFYTTSMGIVRTTFERCRKVRKILETLMVKFEERDVFMNRGFQQEVRERLGTSRVIVPQIFVEGRHLGSAEILEQLNEIGHLRELLRPYKRQSVGGTCPQCGGYRYLLCPICGGSKKSVTHRHHFSEDLVALRCVTCDESGLIRCPQCINGEG